MNNLLAESHRTFSVSGDDIQPFCTKSNRCQWEGI